VLADGSATMINRRIKPKLHLAYCDLLRMFCARCSGLLCNKLYCARMKT